MIQSAADVEKSFVTERIIIWMIQKPEANMKWEIKEGIPIYTQLVQQMKSGIASGEYSPGSRMPSVRDLAMEAGVNPNTMQRALAELERNGLVFTERTSGRFITEDNKLLAGLRSDLAAEHIGGMFEQLRKLGMDDQEIVRSVKHWAGEVE